MKTVGLFEAKTKLSELCAQVVSGGESLVVTRRGMPWVRIEPAVMKTSTMRERRADYMARHGAGEERDVEDFTAPKRSRNRPRNIPLD